MSQTFPTHPDQLTSGWLSQVLGYSVTDFEVTYFSEGAGVMAWVTRVLLTAEAAAPRSIIAKFPSPSQANRDVAAQYQMYEREVRFYQDIAEGVNLRAPACYFAAIDPATQDFVLLMEDLVDMRIGDQVAGCTLDEAKAVLKTLAGFHASAWEPTGYPNLVSHNNAAQVAGMVGGFPIGWPVVLAQFGDLIPQDVRWAGDRMPAAVGPLLERMCQSPVSLVHADARLDNIFFGQQSASVAGAIPAIALVDWQSICTSAPEQDAAYFITQSLAPQVRASEDLVAYYHGQLQAAGVSYTLDSCRQRYRLSALYLLCYAVVIAGTLDLGNERGQALGRTIIGNAFSALGELDAFALLEQIVGRE